MGKWYFFCHNTNHKLGDLQQQKVYSLTVLEAGSPKSKCHTTGGYGKESAPGLSVGF